MEQSTQIRKYRTQMNLSQEELAERIYVTRQSISNWENGKNYPDIHSLLLLSTLFGVSVDQMIKGDMETMKETVHVQEISKLNRYSGIYAAHLVTFILSVAPLFMWLGWYALIPFGILFSLTMYWALKVEKLKKNHDIQTYREIIAFMEGNRLDEIGKAAEKGKRAYQNALKFLVGAGIGAVICALIVLVGTMI